MFEACGKGNGELVALPAVVVLWAALFLFYQSVIGEDISVAKQTKSVVESMFLKKSGRSFIYPGEHVPSIEVKNSVELGRLTALRFLEWIIKNPSGVIALPTGKTPENFLKILSFYKENWKTDLVQKELQMHGIFTDSFPDTSYLKFVQIDEFLPIDPNQKNSFAYYIKTYYLPLLDLKPENILMMDTSAIKDVDQFCAAYEKRIRDWGGIGFFLGGIGPDGHIAFNMRGSPHDSLTRRIHFNYESAAAAATSWGGIEHVRDKEAITIGSQTILHKKDAEIIIMAAGEGKAPVIAAAIEQEKSVDRPASVLHGLPGARFYLTEGAATSLHARCMEDIRRLSSLEEAPNIIDAVLAEVSLARRKPINSLTREDIMSIPFGRVLLEKSLIDIDTMVMQSAKRYREKIERFLVLPSGKSILHTSPHHDDIMLSYHPVAVALLSENINYFAYATSGFNAVTDSYLMGHLQAMNASYVTKHKKDIFSASYEDILRKFALAYAHNDSAQMQEVERIIFAKKLAQVFGKQSSDDVAGVVDFLLNSYFATMKPGEKGDSSIQKLKGYMRESEVDRMWCIHGVSIDRIIHLRSKFYTGDYFTPQPTFQYDIAPILEMLHRLCPDIVTVAFDPEGTGPDTHYKTLQVVAEALRVWKKEGFEPTVWGYRNVWHRFKLHEATHMIPVSAEQFDVLDSIFLSCFSTQKQAPFPSPEYDGPFSKLSIAIQKEQLQKMKTILGDDYFDHHPDEHVRNATGLLFLNVMSTDEFLANAQELKEHTELPQMLKDLHLKSAESFRL